MLGFGGQGTTPFGGASGGGLFGSSGTTGSTFGATQQQTGFGGGGGLFGQSQPTSSPFGQRGVFGSSTTSPFDNPAAGGGGIFGAATQQTSSFGQSGAFGSAGAGAFGQPAGGGLFGQSSSSPSFGQSTLGGGFGGSSMGGFGAGKATGTPPFQEPRIRDSSGAEDIWMSITMMKTVGDTKSFEELRLDDYQLGKGPMGQAFNAKTAGGVSPSGPFGQQHQTGGLFGQTSTATGGLFGGATSTGGGLFGSSTGGIGSSTSTGGGLFGQTQPSGLGSTAGGGLFGAQPQSSTSPFGGQQQQGGGLFGSGGSTAFGQQPQGGVFGQSQSAPTGGGLFGSGAATTPTAGGLFGQSATSTSFGQTGGGLFGQQPQQGGGLFGTGSTQPQGGGLFGGTSSTMGGGTATGGLFGGGAVGTSGGLFGQQQTAGSLFGNQTQAATTSQFGTSTGGGLFGGSSGGGLFGGTSGGTTPQTGAGSLFGGATGLTTPGAAGSGGGLFGTAGTGTGSLLGGSSGTAGSGGLFGQAAGGMTSSTTGGGLFGSSSTGGLFGTAGQGAAGGVGGGNSLFGGSGGGGSELFGSSSGQTGGGLFGGSSGGLFGQSTASGMGVGTALGASGLGACGVQQPQPAAGRVGSSAFGFGVGSELYRSSVNRPSYKPPAAAGVYGDGYNNLKTMYLWKPLPEMVTVGRRYHPPTPPRRIYHHHDYGWQQGELNRLSSNPRGVPASPQSVARSTGSLSMTPRGKVRGPFRPAPAPVPSSKSRYVADSYRDHLHPPEDDEDVELATQLPFNSKAGEDSSHRRGVASSSETPPPDRDDDGFTSPRRESPEDELPPRARSATAPTPTKPRTPIDHERRGSASASRLGEAQGVSPVTLMPIVSGLIPTLTKRNYLTKPTMESLATMSEDELMAVRDFTVTHVGVGEIVWPGATDVRWLNLDEAVTIEPLTVEVAGEEEGVPLNTGLNKPAVITLKNCRPTGDVPTGSFNEIWEKHRKKVKKYTQTMGCEFLNLDENWEWSFKALHFSRYSLLDVSEDNVDAQQQNGVQFPEDGAQTSFAGMDPLKVRCQVDENYVEPRGAFGPTQLNSNDVHCSNVSSSNLTHPQFHPHPQQTPCFMNRTSPMESSDSLRLSGPTPASSFQLPKQRETSEVEAAITTKPDRAEPERLLLVANTAAAEGPNALKKQLAKSHGASRSFQKGCIGLSFGNFACFAPNGLMALPVFTAEGRPTSRVTLAKWRSCICDQGSLPMPPSVQGASQHKWVAPRDWTTGSIPHELLSAGQWKQIIDPSATVSNAAEASKRIRARKVPSDVLVRPLKVFLDFAGDIREPLSVEQLDA
eukprot:GHVN01034726.1.p1 GENE.GHVN01034726.1~~GHVN01034726.1.p1  ORF type:complete len:1328 (+),score=210.57 GHVN01034726.1:222-4205(+)